MTELMKQLQRWATEGRYVPKQEGGFKYFERKGLRHLLNAEQQWGIEFVLDGTIQVWRPVEHYKPKDDERVLLFDPTHTDEYGEPLTTVIGYYREEDGEFHRFESYRNGMTLVHPTHWQPLAQPPQKGGEV